MTRAGLAAVLAGVLMFAACAETPESGPVPAEPPAAGLVVRSVDGVPRPMAKLLAQSVASALAGQGVGAHVGDSADGTFLLDGIVVANTDARATYARHIHWRIHGPDGGDLGGFVQGVRATPWQWQNGDPRLIDGVGIDAAASIMALLQYPPVPVEAPPAAPDGIFIAGVAGAPGDGNRALSDAVERALAGLGFALAADAGQAAYVVDGGVVVEPPLGGRQRVRVLWTVTTADGEELATVEQQKTLPEGSLDAGWSETADRAARPAARSIAPSLPPTGPETHRPRKALAIHCSVFGANQGNHRKSRRRRRLHTPAALLQSAAFSAGATAFRRSSIRGTPKANAPPNKAEATR